MENETPSATTTNNEPRGRAPVINVPLSGDSSVNGRCSPSSPNLRSASSRSRPELVDTRDQGAQIKHGILPDYSLRAKGHIRSVLFDPKGQSSTIHHAKGISTYHRRKSEKDIEHDEKSRDIVKLLHASKYGLYVGVCRSCLKLLNASFECLYVRESEGRINSAVFNSWSGEVLTSGPGNITVSWDLNNNFLYHVHVLNFVRVIFILTFIMVHTCRFGYFAKVQRSLLPPK